DLVGGHRHAVARPTRHGHGARVGGTDGSRCRGARGGADVRPGRGDRGAHPRRAPRPARRAGAARDRAGLVGAGRPAAGRRLLPERGADRRHGGVDEVGVVPADGRIDAFLVCGGKYHDFDFARLRLLELLAEDERVRVKIAQHFHDVELIGASKFLVTYTCDVRPTEGEQRAIRKWVERGGRLLALHGTKGALGPPVAPGGGVLVTTRG